MKIRKGFVSNSSSSSFCIVGLGRTWQASKATRVIGKISKAAGWNENSYCSHGIWHADKLDTFDDLEFLGDEEIYYVGMGLKSMLQEGMTLGEMRTAFIELVDELTGLKIGPEEVDLHYGEVGSG